MDIAALSSAISQVNTGTEVGTALLSKAMDQDEKMGQGIVEMIDAAAMERSVNPAIGSNFDFHI